MDLDCEGWKAMVKTYPDMDFSAELTEKPELAKFLRASINTHSLEIEDPLEMKEAPKLDDDFSKYIILNGIPKCDDKKLEKLNQKVLMKLLSKAGSPVEESAIEHQWDDAHEKTVGCCFINFKNEEQAKIAAMKLNGHELDKKHTFSSCTLPDYNKIIENPQDALDKKAKRTDYLEINAQVLDTKKSQYGIQTGKVLTVKSLMGQTKVLHNLDESQRMPDYDPFNSDKQFSWSPRGTYMNVIKADRVDFVGGRAMEPILTIEEPKVDFVKFSPCERYILLYTPLKERPFQIWNFAENVLIRDFEQVKNEEFMWSYDGNFIAKKTFKVIPKEAVEVEGEEEKQIEEAEPTEEDEKVYVSIFEMPSCKLLKDDQGDRTSIYVEGLRDFEWAPHKNVIVYTSFPEGENAYPRIIMTQIRAENPTRQILKTHTTKDSKELQLFWHPQGSYLAVMNMFVEARKREKHSVELFETKEMRANEIAHMQIAINRQVIKFHGCFFEPTQAKIAIHAQSKRIVEQGAANFSNETSKNLVDLYQIKSDATIGFHLKPLGTMAGEKIQEVFWSGAGNILCTIDTDGLHKNSLNFFMIQKNAQDPQSGGGKQPEKGLHAVQDTYEFRKLAKWDVKDRAWVGKWDQHGRYFCLHGRKPTMFDKQPKTLRFFNMFGELVDNMEDIKDMSQVQFRPRPNDLLKPEKIKQLKKDYKKKYEKIFKEEESAETKVQKDIVTEKRRIIREDFLTNFFIPLRQKYEAKMHKFQALFPIKEGDMAENAVDTFSIHQHGEVVTQRKLENI